MTSVRLKNLATLNPESLPETTSPTFEFRYIDIGSVGRGRLAEEPEWTTFAEAPTRARRRIRGGDTIMSGVRTYLKAVLPIDTDTEDAIVSTGFAVIRPDNVDSRFLAWAVQSDRFIEEVVARSVGVSYPAINPSSLGDIRVLVPASEEQLLIADFLDRETHRIDALVDAKKRLIDLLAEKRTALITHAVTKGLDPSVPMKDSVVEWMGPIPSHWDMRTLGTLVEANNAGEVIDKTFWYSGAETLFTCARDPLPSSYPEFPLGKRTGPHDLLLRAHAGTD